VNLTVSFADFPGSRFGVFLPLILKSCVILPLLTTVKITVPVAGMLRFENPNLNSEALTVILVVAFAA
jgi:hypothetical protein